MERTKNASESIAPMGITRISDTDLSNSPESRYECPICLNWLREPVITTCGHRFCKSCITSWLSNSGHCPIDNVDLSMKVDIFPDNFTKREIHEQRMSCPFASKGCMVKVAPLDLDKHMISCEYNQPEQSSSSNTRLPCSFHPLCKEAFDNQEELTQHLQNDIQTHLSHLMNAYSEIKINNDISSTDMDSKATEAMCMWEPDKNQNGAESTLPQTSVSGLIRSLYERVVVLEQRNREQDILIKNISQQLSAVTIAKGKQNNDMILRYCLGNYIWRIENFKARVDAMLNDHSKMLFSPGFFTSPNGYRFCIRLNISSYNPEYFALNLHLMRTENDECLEWPFNGRIATTMINQYDPMMTQRDTMMSDPMVAAFLKPTADIGKRGFGYSEYTKVRDVFRDGFVRNDTLVIRVHIKCV